MNSGLLFYLTSILALGSVAQWLAWRLRMPAILPLLVFGFVAGQFTDPAELIGEDLLFTAVSLSVAVILFEGGLSLRLSELEESGQVILRLVTVGALVTSVLGGVAAWLILGFTPAFSALLGAILCVTGPTVIGPILQQVRPMRRVGSIANWESIVIDPIGATLAVLVFEAMRGETLSDTLLRLGLTVGVGTVVGLAATVFIVQVLRRHWIPDYLQNVSLLTAVVAAFSASNWQQAESGLVAVTVFGIALANQKTVTIKHLIEFKENLRVLLISTLFILLASLVSVERLWAIGTAGFVFLGALLVIRLIAVVCASVGTTLQWRERLFLSWLAPRGIVAAAVSSLFAIELASGGESHDAGEAGSAEFLEQASQLAPVTFFVIVGTVVLYGLTAGPVARWLRLADPNPQGVLFVGADKFVRLIAKALHDEGYHVLLVDTNHRHIAAARMQGMPGQNASILSDYIHDEIDLGGIGRLLAMTSSSEVNALATLEFSHVFGRSEVYQLPTGPSGAKRQETVSPHLRGRQVFGEEVTYDLLAKRAAAGALLKKTRISEEFSYDDFRALYGPTAIVLFIIESSGALTVATTEKAVAPKPGQTLISLVDPIDEARPPA